MKLYHCAKSRSVRVMWLLEELGLEYEVVKMSFDPDSLQSADYLAINPFGKVPVLVDGATTMSESVAIVQYILNRYGDGRLEPDRNGPEYGKFLQWLHFGESTMMGPVAQMASHMMFFPEELRNPAILEQGRKTWSHYLSILDKELADKDYLCGNEFSAADIVVAYGLFIVKVFRLAPDGGHANVEAYYQRLSSRPAFQKAAAD